MVSTSGPLLLALITLISRLVWPKAIEGSRMTRANGKQENCSFLSLKNPWLCLVWMIWQCLAFQCSVFILSICFCYVCILASSQVKLSWISYAESWMSDCFFMKSSKNYHAFCPRNPLNKWLNSIKLSYMSFVFVSFMAKMTFIYDSTHNLVDLIR